MTGAVYRMVCPLLALAALLTACGSGGNEIVLELNCLGDEVIDAQPVRHSVTKIYRLTSQASAIEIRDPQTGRFTRWGTGRVSIDRGSAAYTGEIRPMNEKIRVTRKIEFDRPTKQIRDHVEGSWGSVAEFSGTCQETLK